MRSKEDEEGECPWVLDSGIESDRVVVVVVVVTLTAKGAGTLDRLW